MAVTWNPSDKSADLTLSNGNLTVTHSSGSTWAGGRATNSKASGKFYWEVRVDTDNPSTAIRIGIGTSAASLSSGVGDDINGYGYGGRFGKKYYNGGNPDYGATYTAGDIIGVALDLDAGKIWWSKNGVWQASGDPGAGTGEAYSGISGTFFPMQSTGVSGDVLTARFHSSDFTYSPPSGFIAFDNISEVELSEEVGIQGALEGELPFHRLLSETVAIQDSLTVEATSLVALTEAVSIQDAVFTVDTYFISRVDNAGVGDAAEGLIIYLLVPYDAYHLHNVDTPSVEYIITSPLGEVDLELPLFGVEIYSGATIDIELSVFEVEAIATVGSVYEVDVVLSSLSIEAKTGSQVDIELPKLDVGAEALVGVTAEADLELQLVELDASALLDVLANLDVNLPKLLVTSGGIYGAVVSGDVKLYPLRLSAEGYAGELGTVDVSLPNLVVEAELSHVPVGEGDMEFPSFDVNAELTLLRDSCLDLNILEYSRWS